MEMRRLDPVEDEQLVREAVGWINEQPQFFRDCYAAWGNEDADDYLELMKNEPQADFGVFEGDELISVITVALEGSQIFNSHLMVKRGANVHSIAAAAANVLRELFKQNVVREGWAWIAQKNYGARKILEMIGLKRDGCSQYRGQSHGQPIFWLRYSVRAR